MDKSDDLVTATLQWIAPGLLADFPLWLPLTRKRRPPFPTLALFGRVDADATDVLPCYACALLRWIYVLYVGISLSPTYSWLLEPGFLTAEWCLALLSWGISTATDPGFFSDLVNPGGLLVGVRSRQGTSFAKALGLPALANMQTNHAATTALGLNTSSSVTRSNYRH